MNIVKGYKVFNPDFTCIGKQYTCPGKFEEDVELDICNKGMHFCKKPIDCFKYYSFDSNNRVAEVIAYGDVTEKEDKCCTNKLEIIREISWHEVLELVNIGKNCTGLGNTGYRNTGDCNTGYYNTGYRNTGDCNTGDYNTGYYNTGDCNTGNYNTGYRNTGYRNTGDCNTGDCNTGDYNTGDMNLSDNNTGCFCTEEHKIKFFDTETDITLEQWRNSEAYRLILRVKSAPVEWVSKDAMSNEEKENHPEYSTIGGYIKKRDISKAYIEWWDSLTNKEKDIIKAIPNFDEKKFELITGIKVE